MKKLLAMLLVLLLIVGCSNETKPEGEDTTTPDTTEKAPETEEKTDGETPVEGETEEGAVENNVFEGTADGFGGPLKVKVTIDGDKITNVEVVEHGETDGISDPAMEQIPQQIVEKNSVNVDTVADATGTSNGIIEAVKAAIQEAGLKLEDFQ